MTGETIFPERHKPVHGGLTVAIRATDTREKGPSSPNYRLDLSFGDNQATIVLIRKMRPS